MKKSNWCVLIELLVIIAILLPILLLSLYAVPYSDDFTNAANVNIQLEAGKTYLGVALTDICNIYQKYGGYYFSVFLNMFINPLSRSGIWGIRIFVLFANFAFYISLYFLIESLLGFFYQVAEKKKILFVYILILFAFLNIDLYAETLTWYTGMISYVCVYCVLIWGVIFFINGLKKNNKIWIALAAVCGFLASGGALNVVALGCGIFLLLGTVAFLVFHRRKEAIICFGSSLTGAIVNVMAPGNYTRHKQDIDGGQLAGAVKSAVFHFWDRGQSILWETPYILILVILLLFAFTVLNSENKYRYPLPGLITVLLLSGCVIVNFPVCLGYSNYFPGRCCWVQDSTIYLATFVLAFYWAGWLRTHDLQMKMGKEMVWCLAICSCFYLCSLGSDRKLDDYPVVQIYKQLSNGTLSEYNDFWMDVLSEIENSDEKDVVLERDHRNKNSFFMDPDIYDTKEDYPNRAVARYYNKDSVIMIYHS